jgi:Uma2 family endonuclease
VLDPREIAPETVRPIRRSEYDHLVALGVLENEHVELLDGMIVQMTPRGPAHITTIDRLTRLLVRAVGDRAWVRVQGSFAASDYSEPEPDLAVLPPGDYSEAHPGEAWLLVEVAESSIRKDRGLKARLYAQCGVPEYWVVNLVDRVIEVHTEPAGGSYGRTQVHQADSTIVLQRLPDVRVAVRDVLGG